MFRTLGIVTGVEHLEAAHVTHIAVEIGTVDSIAALANSSVRTELLPQHLFIQCCVAVKLLNERDRALHFHWLSCDRQSTERDFSITYIYLEPC